MIVNENTLSPIANPDWERGCIVSSYNKPVIHRYIVDKEAVTEEIVVDYNKEMNSKEIRIDIVEPEVGHWETFDEDGNKIEFDGDIPTDLAINGVVSGYIRYELYHRYSAEEIKKINELKNQSQDDVINRLVEEKVQEVLAKRML